MWEDFANGFGAAPLWAQAGMVLFALTAIAMFVAPGVTRRRYAKRFAALAEGLGASTTRGDEFTEWLSVEVNSRRFEVRRELRTRGGGTSSYRGPTGYLLVTSTPLASRRWELHQFEIVQGRLPSIFGAAPLATGDESFDARFLVRQDGDPVRDGWLDAPTRAAVTALFDMPGAAGSLRVEEHALRLLVTEPWDGIDPGSLRALLHQQAALATALERTAGWRGPVA